MDNGVWVMGQLITTEEGSFIAPKVYEGVANVYYFTGFVKVDPESVGQYTGLTDNNGTKIFEGDICAIVSEEKEIIKDDIFVVSWEENCGFNLYICFDYEIIGNIYDNPELLKECESD